MPYPPKFTDSQFLELYRRGLSDKEIARSLGVTPDAVSARRRRKFKLPPNRVYRPWTPEEEQTLIKMREKGFSFEAIAKRLKRCRDAVWLRCNKLGRPREIIKLNLSERQLGWLEGLIDGEGCLSMSKLKFYKQRWTLTVYISNTNRRLLEEVRRTIGYGTITKHISQNKPFKPVFAYHLPRKVMGLLLSKLKLIAKEKQRILLLEADKLLAYKRGKKHCQAIDKKLDRICEKIHVLNQRGVGTSTTLKSRLARPKLFSQARRTCR
jgi:hypothetical protein